MEIRGLGPRRIESITNRFGSLWAARNASSEDLADVPRLPRSLAARLTEELRSL
jgi:excinuclease UvrABC nuclease subunit